MADIEMTIDSVRVSLMNSQHVVILKEKGGERYLPLWIGPVEADAIQVKRDGVFLARPMTHDLMCTFADIAGWKISSARIERFQTDTFYAALVVDSSGKRFEVDCRPSDAIAVSVRMHAPIFVAEEVLKKAGTLIDRETGKPIPISPQKEGGATGVQPKVSEEELSAFKEFIKTLDLEGKNKLN